MTEMLPNHDTPLSPPSLATQRDNCQCTVGQIGQIQPILSWPNWEDGHSSEDTGAPHALSLGATQAPGNNPGNEEARSQRAKHLWWCPQPWVGDMVGPGWLSGGWEMDSLSVILGESREAGASGGWLFHLFSPQLLTRIKGVPTTDCSLPLGWAVSSLPPWTFPWGLQKDTALAEVSLQHPPSLYHIMILQAAGCSLQSHAKFTLHDSPSLCKVYLKINVLICDPIGWFMLSFLESLLGLVHQDCISLNFLGIHAKNHFTAY